VFIRNRKGVSLSNCDEQEGDSRELDTSASVATTRRSVNGSALSRSLALAVARFLQSALVGRPAAGQEPVAAAICAHLTSEDAISATHRPHLLAIAQVVALRPMTAEIFGRQTWLGR